MPTPTNAYFPPAATHTPAHFYTAPNFAPCLFSPLQLYPLTPSPCTPRPPVYFSAAPNPALPISPLLLTLPPAYIPPAAYPYPQSWKKTIFLPQQGLSKNYFTRESA